MRDLFLAAFAGDEEAERTLHLDPSEEVYSMAVEYCASAIAVERVGALSILAIWGSRWGSQRELHVPERVELALHGLQDPEIAVVRMAAFALANLRERGVLDRVSLALIQLRDSLDAQVRWAVANGIGSCDEPAAVETMLLLMRDEDDEVRNWATFALGRLSELNTVEIREALRARLSDSYIDVRHEAVWSLALRRDREGLSILAERLVQVEWVEGDECAAEEILGVKELPAAELAQALRVVEPLS